MGRVNHFVCAGRGAKELMTVVMIVLKAYIAVYLHILIDMFSLSSLQKITFNSVTNCLGPRKVLFSGTIYKVCFFCFIVTLFICDNVVFNIEMPSH